MTKVRKELLKLWGTEGTGYNGSLNMKGKEISMLSGTECPGDNSPLNMLTVSLNIFYLK